MVNLKNETDIFNDRSRTHTDAKHTAGFNSVESESRQKIIATSKTQSVKTVILESSDKGKAAIEEAKDEKNPYVVQPEQIDSVKRPTT